MSTGIICGNEACGMELDPDPPSGRQPCPACGSMARTQTVVPRDEAQVLEELGGKQKRDTEKIPTFETDDSVLRETGEQRSFSLDDEKREIAEHITGKHAKMKSGAR